MKRLALFICLWPMLLFGASPSYQEVTNSLAIGKTNGVGTNTTLLGGYSTNRSSDRSFGTNMNFYETTGFYDRDTGTKRDGFFVSPGNANGGNNFILSDGGTFFDFRGPLTGRSITNRGPTGLTPTVWISTNATPSEPAPDGSIATVTDGRLYSRTNGAWVLVAAGVTGGGGDGIPTLDGSGTNTLFYWSGDTTFARIDVAVGVLRNTGGIETVDWLDYTLKSASGQEAVNWESRVLKNTIGSTVFDWSGDVPIFGGYMADNSGKGTNTFLYGTSVVGGDNDFSWLKVRASNSPATFNFNIQSSTNNGDGTFDNVASFGWNQASGAGLEVAGEPAYGFRFEREFFGNYETYMEFRNPSGVAGRPWSWLVGRTNGEALYEVTANTIYWKSDYATNAASATNELELTRGRFTVKGNLAATTATFVSAVTNTGNQVIFKSAAYEDFYDSAGTLRLRITNGIPRFAMAGDNTLYMLEATNISGVGNSLAYYGNGIQSIKFLPAPGNGNTYLAEGGFQRKDAGGTYQEINMNGSSMVLGGGSAGGAVYAFPGGVTTSGKANAAWLHTYSQGYSEGIFDSAASMTLTATNGVVNFTGATLTCTLPTAVGIKDRKFTVKNSNAIALTIATTSGQTIDGTTPVALTAGQSRTYQSDGGNWLIISGYL